MKICQGNYKSCVHCGHCAHVLWNKCRACGGHPRDKTKKPPLMPQPLIRNEFFVIKDIKDFVRKAMKEEMIVAIIMVTFNRWELTEKTLSSIFRNTFMPYSLTIVDNGSHDGTIEKLKNLKRDGVIDKLILLPKNMGIGMGKNFGLKAWKDKAEWFVCIDNDIEIRSPYWLAYLCFASTLRGFGVIGANVEGFETHRITSHGSIIIDKCPTTLGGIYAMHRTTFRKVGYFREYSLYGIEDWEMGLRQWSFFRLRNAYVRNVNAAHIGGKKYDKNIHMKDGRIYEEWKREMKQRTWEGYKPSTAYYETKVTGEDIEKYTWRSEND